MSAAAFVPTIYMTVADMAERYVRKLEGYANPSYCKHVGAILNRHLVRDYGPMPINDFGMAEASAVINDMRRSRCSNTSIYDYCRIIRAAFESELRNGRLYDNPWNHVHIPKTERVTRRILSDEEVRALEEAFDHNALGDYFGLILNTGLKRTEAAGVIRKNWDQRGHRLAVSTYLDYNNPAGVTLRQTPYNGVAQTIPLTRRAEEYLGHALESQSVCRRGFPAWHNPNDLVFTNYLGHPVNRADISYNARVIRRLTGIPDFSCRLLREHFVVSRLGEGVPIHVMTNYLGFRGREAVLSYADLRSEGTGGAARAMENLFDEIAPQDEGVGQ